jgi:Tol biopolymer transport system component
VDRKSPKDTRSIWLLSMETLEKQQMTTPDSSIWGDYSPTFSPDGRYLAFVRQFEAVRRAIYFVHLPRGKPKFVTDYRCPMGVCWTADSRELIFNTHGAVGDVGLWRVSVQGGEPRAVPTRGESVAAPTVRGNRLAYVSFTGNPDIWRLDLTGPQGLRPPTKPLFSWSSYDEEPQVSPDGSRIAFTSDSSGSKEVWVCNADGTGAMKLTDMKDGTSGSPYWSPDGKNIAFDATQSGIGHIYIVSAEGGRVRRITTDPAEEVKPRWSRGGHWIYYGSNRGGSWQIWKVPSEGGKAIQVTKEGGMVAQESTDGYVYYYGYYDVQKQGIWRVPISGGPETLVLDRQIYPHLWDVTNRGIYFIDGNSVCFYDFRTQAVRSLVPLHMAGDGLSVSPDGRWLLYSGGIRDSHIMMIDNFR